MAERRTATLPGRLEPGQQLRIGVLMGGPSAEREVSLRSGAAVARALRERGHAVEEIDPREGRLELPEGLDAAFLALHGTWGEDGTVQRLLESLGVPYTGCGPEASRIAFDKPLTKERLIAAGVPTAPYAVVKPGDPLPGGLRLPLVIKPACQGSSVGLQFLEAPGDWNQALAAAAAHDARVLVEERISGREVTVGILETRALPLVEVRPRGGAYDYASKYTPGRTDYVCPADFSAWTTLRVQSAALAAFAAVGGRDYGRVDIMVTGEWEPVVLEINTLPGMTETSLLPKAAAALGISFPELCETMVRLALRRAGKEAA